MSFRLQEAEKEVATLPAVLVAASNEPTTLEKDEFNRLAQISPRAGIMEIRADIEEALHSAASANGFDPKGLSMIALMRTLLKNNVINDQTFALLDDLRAIGNNAAHSTMAKFTKADALRYRSLAVQALGMLATARLAQLPGTPTR